MRRSVRWTVVASVVTALAMFAAACGGSNNNKRQRCQQDHRWHVVKQGKQGGKLTMLAAGDVDYIDPGQTYYQWGYAVQYVDNRTLYSFKPDDSVNPVPDLATGRPEISADNKTITVHIRKGVKFSPPVNREIKAAGHQVRVRARLLQARSERVRRHVLQLDSRHSGEAEYRRNQADLGHRDA